MRLDGGAGLAGAGAGRLAMNDETIGGWLDELASSAPAPGGGAAGALEVAMGAALVEMVCNLTIGKPAFAEHEATMTAARGRATEIRHDAVGLAAEDAAAFDAVIAAYRLPKDDEGRPARIQEALAVAADVPRRTAAAASEVIDLAGQIVPGANPNVVSDAAAAAGAARGALQASLVNIDANRASITDPQLRGELDEAARAIERDLTRADAVVAAVRERMAG
jgi:formiminotetrahydrofolate cyclodeaminase